MISFQYLKSYTGVLKILTILTGALVSILGMITHSSACIDPRFNANFVELGPTDIDMEFDCRNLTIKCKCTTFIAPAIKSIHANCTAVQEKVDFIATKKLNELKESKLAENETKINETALENMKKQAHGECRYIPVAGLEEAFLVVVIVGTFASVLNMTVCLMLDHFAIISDSLKLFDLTYNAMSAALFIAASMLLAISAAEIDEYPAKVKCLHLNDKYVAPENDTWNTCYTNYSKSFEDSENLEFKLNKNRERDFSMFRLKLVTAGFTLLNGINYCILAYVVYGAWKKLFSQLRKLTIDSKSSDDFSEKSSEEEFGNLTDEEGSKTPPHIYQPKMNVRSSESAGDVGAVEPIVPGETTSPANNRSPPVKVIPLVTTAQAAPDLQISKSKEIHRTPSGLANSKTPAPKKHAWFSYK